MELRPGYKQTEVGVIPEDWDAVPLAALGDFSKGSGVRKDEAKSGDLPCIRYGEIYTHHNDIVRDYHSYISRAVAATAKRLKRGDILFAGSGETKEEIGKAASFVSCAEAYAGGDIVILSPRTCSSEFLGYALNAPEVARQKSSKGQGDAVVHISTSALASISVAVPPLPEQSAIATALSDVDALLAAQDALIAKKRAIKQGAMQELLTGKRRLPGFCGEWEVKRLGELAHIRNQKVSTSQVDQETLCVELENVGQGSGRLESRSNAGSAISTKYTFQVGDVLFGRLRSYLRKYWIATESGLCTTEIWPLATDERLVPSYLFALVQTDAFIDAASIAFGTHMPRADWGVIRNFEISLPSTEEQAAISKVMNDMDAEVFAMEAAREKIAKLKQGMMQALLTGRIRLV